MRAKYIAQGHNIETMMSQRWEKHDISLILQILYQAGIGELSRQPTTNAKRYVLFFV